MTTAVTIDAHAGWPVKVEQIDTASGAVRSTTTVLPNTQQTFHIWDGSDIRAHEMRRDELPAPPAEVEK